MSKATININNRHFKSFSQAARLLGLKRSTLVSRYHAAGPGETIDTTPPDKKVTIGNTTYESLTIAANHLRVDRTTLRSRLQDSDRPAKEIASTSRLKSRGKLRIDGLYFASPEEMCEHFGINLQDYETLIRHRYTALQAAHILIKQSANADAA